MGLLFSAFKSEKTNSSFSLEDEKKEKNNELGLRIYICGNLPQKKEFVKIFNEKISDPRYINNGELQFKKDQFYWIAKIFEDHSKETMSLISSEIKKDYLTEGGIEQNVIVCFGDENINDLFNDFQNMGNLYYPLFIIISQKEIKVEVKYDLRKITNILLKEQTQQRLNNIIISRLWEYDCYYNEKGNKLCKYTPDNIFTNLYNNVPFYSINILLTGKSRSGKSTFINYLSNKLIALETCKKISVSKKKTEYCLYTNDNNYEIAPLKFIDTPGIVPEKKEESLKFLEDLLDNRENNLEEQIHFILFFFMENESLEGIDEIFKLLNNCGRPVLFIINKSTDESDNGKSKDIGSTINLLTQKDCKNLIDENNFKSVNIVKTKKLIDYGVNEIFERIYEIFKEKNDFSNKKGKFNKSIDHEIEQLLTKYINLTEKPLEMQTKDKDYLDFNKEVEELKDKINSVFQMFKPLEINSIITTGSKSINKCRNLINSLGDLSDVLHSVDNEIPAISFFQAYLVKEIGEILGFNMKEMKKEVNNYFKQLKEKINDMDIFHYYNINKTKRVQLNINKEDIEKELKKELDKSNNEFIKQLASLFHKIREENIKNENKSPKEIDKAMTDGICIECRDYLIEVLKKSQGIIFWKNYLNNCRSLKNDLKILKEKTNDDWGKNEMKVISE